MCERVSVMRVPLPENAALLVLPRRHDDQHAVEGDVVGILAAHDFVVAAAVRLEAQRRRTTQCAVWSKFSVCSALGLTSVGEQRRIVGADAPIGQRPLAAQDDRRRRRVSRGSENCR